jgi:hypothetical protein
MGMHETSMLTFRGVHGLRAYETRALRRKFGPKENVIIADKRRQYNEELRNLHYLANITRTIKS